MCLDPAASGGDGVGKRCGLRLARGWRDCSDDPSWATHSNPKALCSKVLVTFVGKVSITAGWGHPWRVRSRGSSTQGTRSKSTSINSAFVHITKRRPLQAKKFQKGDQLIKPWVMACGFRRKRYISPTPTFLKYAPSSPSVRPGHLPYILYHRVGTEASSSPFLLPIMKVDVMLELKQPSYNHEAMYQPA